MPPRNSLSQSKTLNAADLLKQFNLTTQDRELIRQFAALTQVNASRLVDDFYLWLSSEVWYKAFFPHGLVEQVKDLQSNYWAEFLRAQIDDSYVNRRIKLGNVHAKINLPATAYIAGMNFCQCWFDQALTDARIDDSVRQNTGSAIARLIQIDTAIVMHAYAERSTEQLQKSQSLQTAVMNASLAPMLTIDGHGIIQFVSASIEQTFGWRAKEITGKNIKMLMPDPYQSEHDRYLENYRKTGSTGIIGKVRTLKALRKNGEIFDCAISVSRVDTGNDADPLFTGIIQDVSDRVAFETRIDEIDKVLQAVAKGDLSQQIDIMGAEDKLGQAVFAVVQSFQEIVSQANNIATGNIDIEIHARGETDQVSEALTNMTNTLRSVAAQANTISLGDYSAEIAPRSEQDALGKALYNMTQALRLIAGVAEAIAVGDFSTKVEIKGQNDKLGLAINQIVDNFNAITKQANTIAKGNYSTEIAPRSERDELGKALATMTNSLREVSASNKSENWLKTGQAELGDHLRGEQDLATMCRNVITYLCKYLGAQVGVFYLIDEDQVLRMQASYAFTRRKGLSNEIRLGEGLVGQAALEKEPIVISNVPEDYIAVNSGLGQAVPRHMMVAPVLQDNQLTGMLEVGSFQPFSDDQIELLTRVNENIAIAIKSSRDSDKMKELLEESQKTSEELQSQQEELKAANEEMEEQTRALQSSEQALKAQSEKLQNSNAELEEKSTFLEQQKAEIEKQNSAIEASRKELVTKAQELELSSQYKSEFLANMSHELRTPLNSLLILSKSLAENRPGNLTDDQVESAQTVYSGGQDLLELINDILDLSKVEAGKLSVHIDNLDLDELQTELARKFKPLTDDKGLLLNFDVAENAPGSFVSDNQRTRQILKNLLSNAIKFTSAGSVTVSVHRPQSDVNFVLSNLTHDRAIGISVTDTGIGIPEDKQQAIFEAFQQADGSTNRRFGGTGLGLTISRELARLLGGEIQLHSAAGAGSTFTLYLPLDGPREAQQHGAPATASVSSARPPSMAMGKKQQAAVTKSVAPHTSTLSAGEADTIFLPDDRKRIGPNDKSLLIIEDDRAFAQSLLRLVHEKGYKCVSAGDGRSGLHLAQKYRPSGIILDLGLPDIDGLDVLAQLKHNLATRHIPVHIMSASDARSAAMQAGAFDFLSKPATFEGLEASLQKIGQMLSNELKRLLVVEDNDDNRKAVVKLLEHKEIEIIDVGDGATGLQKLSDESFDCIILDLDLPGMSGFEFLKAAKNQPQILLPPVIIHTGRELNEDEHRELQHCADSIVIKGASSPERLLDEASLFLHSVTSRLPQEQQAMIKMMHEPDQPLSGKQILLVDDDIRNTFALSKELREHGLQMILADNGQLALEQLDKHPDIAMVLMDIMMPVMDGHEAMRKIRAHAKYKRLPIIALTALAMSEDKVKCKESGANDYLAKPIDVEQLLSMMRIWLFSGQTRERRTPDRPWQKNSQNGGVEHSPSADNLRAGQPAGHRQ